MNSDTELAEIAHLLNQERFLQSGTNQFEIVCRGSMEEFKKLPSGSVALIRDTRTWLAPSGKLARVYGMADGSSQIVESDDNFQTWEAEHVFPPPRPISKHALSEPSARVSFLTLARRAREASGKFVPSLFPVTRDGFGFRKIIEAYSKLARGVPAGRIQPSMSNDGKFYVDQLNALLGERAKDVFFTCAQDMVENGLDLSRFAEGEPKPYRQLLTQYLAAWSRHAGLNEEQTMAWLVEFCADRLKSISRRTPAAIRHSTKGNVRYIHRSNLDFICGGPDNIYKVRCRPDCPVFQEMEVKRKAKALEEHQRMYLPPKPPPPPVIVPTVKERHRDQFQEAIGLIRDQNRQGVKQTKILQLLNDRGYKTRTGRKWTYSNLSLELHRVRTSPIPPVEGEAASSTEIASAEASANNAAESTDPKG